MAERPPRPSPSPRPQTERPELGELEEPQTDPRLLAHDPQALHQYLKQKRDEEHAAFMGKIKALAAAIAVVAAAVIGAILFLDNRVEAQTKRHLEVQTERHDVLKGRVDRVEQQASNFDKKLDLALDALRVPQSVRPQPLDGGRP